MNDEKDVDAAEKLEAEAAGFGWVSEDEFEGEGNHMSAEAFMLRGPGTSRKLQKQLEEAQGQITDLKSGTAASFARMEHALKARAEVDVETRATEIAGDMRTAAETGDMDAYDTHAKELQKQKSETQDAIPPVEKQAIDAWIPDNPWFEDDPVARGEAAQYYRSFTGRGMAPAEALKKTTERVKLRHPYLFPKEPDDPKRPAVVDGGGLLPANRSSKKKSWADVPAEDRVLVKDQIESGEWDALAKEMKTSPKEAFASKYWEQDE